MSFLAKLKETRRPLVSFSRKPEKNLEASNVIFSIKRKNLDVPKCLLLEKLTESRSPQMPFFSEAETISVSTITFYF